MHKYGADSDEAKEYIQDAYKTIQEAYVYKYIKKKYNDYTEYTILDQHENYYTFKCFGGYNYEVILDIYTLNTQIYLSGYTDDIKKGRDPDPQVFCSDS